MKPWDDGSGDREWWKDGDEGLDDTPPSKGRKKTREEEAQAKAASAYFSSPAVRAMSDEEWCLKHLKIVDMDGELVAFGFNEAQQLLVATIREQVADIGMVRLVILKARQMRMSATVQALMFRAVVEHENTTAFVLAHEKIAVARVFERTQTFADELKNTCKHEFPRKFSNQKELIFKPPHRSGIRVHMAKRGAAGVGRGGTDRLSHLSEVAFWTDAGKNMRACLKAIPDRTKGRWNKGTWIVVESTANGVGGEFYDLYWNAKKAQEEAKKAGRVYTGFRALFLPWGIDKQYRIEGAKLEDHPADPEVTEDEPDLRARGYDDEQLAFRRREISGKFNGDVAMFKQEMPSNDREAFITSGRPVFTLSRVQKRINEIVEREKIAKPSRFHVDILGYQEWKKRRRDRREIRQPEPDFRGDLWVYEAPIQGQKYLVSADVALGGGSDMPGPKGGDYSVAHVYNRATGKQAAVWRARIDPDLYGHVLDAISLWYNGAEVAPEDNSIGLVTIKSLIALDANVYIRERHDVSSVIADTVIDRYGWQTNERSKGVAVSALRRAFRTGAISIEHLATLQEMSTFVMLPNGSMGAQNGCFDDEVIAAAIACAIMEANPLPGGELPKQVAEEGTVTYYLDRIRERERGGPGRGMAAI